MKKYSALLAIFALVLASLACQTVMGGGDNNFEVPDIQNVPNLPETDGSEAIPTVPPATTESDGGDVTLGGESKFPVTSDAFNVVTAPDVVTFQTNMSTDDVLKFYRDEFTAQGYEEDSSMALVFGKTFTLAFNGYEGGKVIYVVGADGGDGSLYVTITLG